jgi:hypothetical protein
MKELTAAFAHMENPEGDKLAQAITNGLREWASSLNSSGESPTKNEPPDPSSSDAPPNQ